MINQIDLDQVYGSMQIATLPITLECLGVNYQEIRLGLS